MIRADMRCAYRELEARLRPFVARRVSAASEVDDVMQDVFLRMQRSLPDLREEEHAADMMGVSLSGMKSRVQRGREKLRELLEDCCEIALDARGRVIGCEPRPNGKQPPDCCCGDPEPDPSARLKGRSSPVCRSGYAFSSSSTRRFSGL